MSAVAGLFRAVWIVILLAAHALDAIIWIVRAATRIVDLIFKIVVIAFLLLLLWLLLSLGGVRIAFAQDPVPTPTPAAITVQSDAHVSAAEARARTALENAQLAQADAQTKRAEADTALARYRQAQADYVVAQREYEQAKITSTLAGAEAAAARAAQMEVLVKRREVELQIAADAYMAAADRASQAVNEAAAAVKEVETIKGERDKARSDLGQAVDHLKRVQAELDAAKQLLFVESNTKEWLLKALFLSVIAFACGVIFLAFFVLRKRPVTLRELQPIYVWSDSSIHNEPPIVNHSAESGESVDMDAGSENGRRDGVFIIHPDIAMEAVRELDREFGKHGA
jgi:hypothetical protein